MSTVPGFKVVRYGPNTYFLGGELDLASAPILSQAVEASLASGGAILLDLGVLTFIDASGIRAILQMSQKLGDEGCILLHAPQPRVLRVLELVGIESAANIHVDGCVSSTHPNAFLEWETPVDIDREFEELRALGGDSPAR
jgi:anti-anti-sigma factor